MALPHRSNPTQFLVKQAVSFTTSFVQLVGNPDVGRTAGQLARGLDGTDSE
jgi:hypothetical protein